MLDLIIYLLKQWLVDLPSADLRLLSFIGITVHWIILQYTIGLLLISVLTEIVGRRKDDPIYLTMANTYSKIAVVIFAVGAVTGSFSEFGLILLWPNLTEIVGKYFFFPLYLEIFAFMAEVVFVYMYFYTWGKVSHRYHIITGLLAALGALYSAFMIMTINTLMSYPPGLIPGYDPSTGTWSEPSFVLILPTGMKDVLTSSELRDILLSNPSNFHEVMLATLKFFGAFTILFLFPGAIISFLHAVTAAFATTLFTIIGVYSYRYLRAKNEVVEYYYKKGLKAVSGYALLAMALQGLFGDLSARIVAQYTPEKLAAMEGTSESIISITKLIPFLENIIAFLSYGSFDAHLPSWDAIPAEWRPPLILHYIYYTKIGLAILLGIDVLILVIFYYVLKKDPKKWHLKLNLAAPFLIHVVSVFGWMVREIGRKPWTVYGIVKVEEAARQSPLPLYLTMGMLIYIVSLGAGLLLVVLFLFGRQKGVTSSK